MLKAVFSQIAASFGYNVVGKTTHLSVTPSAIFLQDHFSVWNFNNGRVISGHGNTHTVDGVSARGQGR